MKAINAGKTAVGLIILPSLASPLATLSRLLPASFGKSQHRAPVLFRRATRTVKFRRAFELKLRRRQFSPPDTFFRFLIQKLRFRSRAAKLCQALHDYRPFIRAAADTQFVAETHDPTWLRAS